jgi:hypothetical protein
MLSFNPAQMFLTHFGRIDDVPRCANDLHVQIDRMVEIARTHAREADRHDRIKDALGALYVGRSMAHGCALPSSEVRELLAMDIELNAQGLEIWLDRSDKN